MSTKPTINLQVTATKNGFTFCDKTGKYGGSNTTGWKPGVWSINNASYSYVRLTLSDGQVLPPLVLDGFPSLECVCRELIPADFSMTEFESGKYTLEYVIVLSDSPEGPTSISTEIQVYHFGKVNCCIETKKKSTCDYKDKKYQDYLFLDLLLEQAKLAACKGDESSADTILTYLNNICNCKCC